MSKRGTQPSQSQLKEPRIKAELDRLNDLFSSSQGIDQNKLDFIQRQIEQLAWYNVSIADLQKKIDHWGTLITYDNGGGQSGVKTNPDLKTLIDYQKAATAIVKTLMPFVPVKSNRHKSELDQFRIVNL